MWQSDELTWNTFWDIYFDMLIIPAFSKTPCITVGWTWYTRCIIMYYANALILMTTVARGKQALSSSTFIFYFKWHLKNRNWSVIFQLISINYIHVNFCPTRCVICNFRAFSCFVTWRHILIAVTSYAWYVGTCLVSLDRWDP